MGIMTPSVAPAGATTVTLPTLRYLSVQIFLPCSHCSGNADFGSSAICEGWRMGAFPKTLYMVKSSLAREAPVNPNCVTKVSASEI